MNFPSTSVVTKRWKAAFTLIEMMVSITILVVLILLITHLFNSAVTLSTNGNKRMDADSQARAVFDRMAIDFGNMVKRPDVDYYVQKNGNGNNDQIAFFSGSAGYYPTTVTKPDTQGGNVSLVGYRINNNKLERLSKGLAWNGVSPSSGESLVFNPQTIAGVWTAVTGTGADPDYQVMGDGVFRMEICFLVRDPVAGLTALSGGTAPPLYLTDSAIVPTPTPRAVPTPSPLAGVTPTATPVPSVYNGMKDVVAIVVTIAVLDTRSQAILQPGMLDGASSALIDSAMGSFPPGTPVTPGSGPLPPASSWENKVESLGLGMPKVAGSQVRIYQRCFYLNPTNQYL